MVCWWWLLEQEQISSALTQNLGLSTAPHTQEVPLFLPTLMVLRVGERQYWSTCERNLGLVLKLSLGSLLFLLLHHNWSCWPVFCDRIIFHVAFLRKCSENICLYLAEFCHKGIHSQIFLTFDSRDVLLRGMHQKDRRQEKSWYTGRKDFAMKNWTALDSVVQICSKVGLNVMGTEPSGSNYPEFWNCHHVMGFCFALFCFKVLDSSQR